MVEKLQLMMESDGIEPQAIAIFAKNKSVDKVKI